MLQRLSRNACITPANQELAQAVGIWQPSAGKGTNGHPYVGITLTMPDVLWPIFQQTRHLLHDLPAVGAAVIQQWAKSKYGVQLLIIVVPHTFGRKLNFNSHLHVLVSAGGLQESSSHWIPGLQFDKKSLMHMWRYAVIAYLREALKRNLLSSNSSTEDLKTLFTTQYERWWNINVDHFKSKWHLLRYAGRYVRRPPIAQHRFLKITNDKVLFWTKDLKLKQKVRTEYLIKDFVHALSAHVADHYRHGMRYFGLLAPRSKGHLSKSVFLLLGQTQRPRPRRLNWAELLQKHFRINPLRDATGQLMNWAGRLKPTA